MRPDGESVPKARGSLQIGGRPAGQHAMAAPAGDLRRDQRPDDAGGTGGQGGAGRRKKKK